jgi:two-component system, LuxR family, response regulator FixJ
MIETNPTDRVIYVVDDDPAARESLVALIKSHGCPVLSFSSGEDFLAQLQPQQRGCLVLDVRMNGISGLDVLTALKQKNSTLPVIMITGFADVPMAVKAMRNGAFTFLEKPCGEQELWRNVEAALSLEQQQYHTIARKTEIQTNYNTLTAGEISVLEKLLEGYPNKTIATELDIGLRTVEMRRAMILKKMGVESLAELVRLIMILRDNQ